MLSANNKQIFKKTRILPFQTKYIHSFFEASLNNNKVEEKSSNILDKKKIKIETKLIKLETKEHKFPRIVRQIEINLGDKIIIIKDMHTEIQQKITDNLTSKFREEIVNDCSTENFSFEENSEEINNNNFVDNKQIDSSIGHEKLSCYHCGLDKKKNYYCYWRNYKKNQLLGEKSDNRKFRIIKKNIKKMH